MSIASQLTPTTAEKKVYVQPRARLQRLDDLEPFNGWVEEITDRKVRLRLGPSMKPLEKGDKVNVEVAGQENTAKFVGEVVRSTTWNVDLAIAGEVELHPKKESLRVNMFGERCKIFLDGEETVAITVDLSETGLGLVLTSGLEPGSMIEFEVGTQLGPIRGAGKILYCRADPFSARRYRAAIEVSNLSPEDQARWNKLQDFTPSPW